MRWVSPGIAVAVIVGALVLWWSGADRVVTAWALEGQREAQGAMAAALRRLRGGDPAAVVALMSVCFGYGFFHAAGPGHGKLLIGGYGAAREIGAMKLSAVAIASSVAQGLTAIALVGVGLSLLGLGREQMTDSAERLFAPASFGAIALIGVWLVWRGGRGLWRLRQAEVQHDHGHGDHHDHHHHDHHDHDAHCGCGHAHVPDPEAVARATTAREMAALIGAVALRPCTGALFLLILTAQLGVFWAGIAGTLAMALGTAAVTVTIAIAATGLRRGVLAGLQDSVVLARAQPIAELCVGAIVAILATELALAAL